jgi:hypothetical protein
MISEREASRRWAEDASGGSYWFGYRNGIRGIHKPGDLVQMNDYAHGILDYYGDKELWDAIEED